MRFQVARPQPTGDAVHRWRSDPLPGRRLICPRRMARGGGSKVLVPGIWRFQGDPVERCGRGRGTVLSAKACKYDRAPVLGLPLTGRSTRAILDVVRGVRAELDLDV